MKELTSKTVTTLIKKYISKIRVVDVEADLEVLPLKQIINSELFAFNAEQTNFVYEELNCCLEIAQDCARDEPQNSEYTDRITQLKEIMRMFS